MSGEVLQNSIPRATGPVVVPAQGGAAPSGVAFDDSVGGLLAAFVGVIILALAVELDEGEWKWIESCFQSNLQLS
jgi:hypothetical protein